jgi:chemotaxis signal transduction protein
VRDGARHRIARGRCPCYCLDMREEHDEQSDRLTAQLQELERIGLLRAAVLREAGPAPATQALQFRLAGRSLVTPVERLFGALPVPRSPTPVPGSARWVLGVASYRGTLLPLYDLRGLLLAEYGYAPRRGYALLVAGRRGLFGAAVDGVDGLCRVRWEPLEMQDLETPSALAALLIGRCTDGSANPPVVDLGRIEQLPAFDVGSAQDTDSTTS